MIKKEICEELLLMDREKILSFLNECLVRIDSLKSGNTKHGLCHILRGVCDNPVFYHNLCDLLGFKHDGYIWHNDIADKSAILIDDWYEPRIECIKQQIELWRQ